MESEEQKVSKKTITIYLVFFFIMIIFIAVAPFVAIDHVKKKTALPPKERIQ